MSSSITFGEKVKFLKRIHDSMAQEDKVTMNESSKNYAYSITLGLCFGLCCLPLLKRIPGYNNLPSVGKSGSRLLLLFIPINIGSSYANKNIMVPTVEDLYSKYKEPTSLPNKS
jgi:hypothetical protein